MNNLPADIAAQMNEDIQRLEAKAKRLAEAAENADIMDLLPEVRLPISYHGCGSTATRVAGLSTSAPNSEETSVASPRFTASAIARSHSRAPGLFIRWVNDEIDSQRNAVADSNVVVQDVSQVVEHHQVASHTIGWHGGVLLGQIPRGGFHQDP